VNDAPWRVELARSAQRDLRRLDPPIRKRVASALEDLADGDASARTRKLSGNEQWRMRVGDWRVRFERNAETRTILVLRVLPRGRAYDR